MSNDAIVEFAQGRFGSDTGLPADARARAPLPEWMAGAEGESTAPVDADDVITVEGSIPTPHEPLPAGDRTTAEDLAYYLPFHFYRTRWGIYIRGSGVWALARRLALPKKLPDEKALGCAYHLLLDHERFHFFAEYAASRVEVVTAETCYEAYFRDKDAALHEEALANAHALRRSQRRAPASVVQAALAWMKAQGPGYCEFSKWLPPRFADGERQASRSMTTKAAAINFLEHAEHPAEFLFRNISNRSVRVYVIFDDSVPWVRVAKPFPKDFGLQVFVYSNDHKPPHIHIHCPPGTARTRYRWGELTPLSGDPPLRASEEKDLHQYIARYRRVIERKISAIEWK